MTPSPSKDLSSGMTTPQTSEQASQNDCQSISQNLGQQLVQHYGDRIVSALGLPEGVVALQTLRFPIPAGLELTASSAQNGQNGQGNLADQDDQQGYAAFNLALHVGDEAALVHANRSALLTALKPFGCDSLHWLTQVHGTKVLDAGENYFSQPNAPEADAWVCTEPGKGCVIMTADCLPVVFVDEQAQVIGCAHAGWRGLLEGVLEATVAAMRQRGAGHIRVWMGAAIGPAAFEVGAEVRAAFVQQDQRASAAFQPVTGNEQVSEANEKWLCDLYELARLRLSLMGIQQVSGGDQCTLRDPRFYSYRREARTGRMATVIWLPSEGPCSEPFTATSI